MNPPDARIRVLCMGNELVCDDGIGIRVGRVLRELPLPERVEIELTPRVGLELLDSLRAGERLVLVDAAVTGRPPGTCFRLTFGELDALAAESTPAHALGVAEVLAVARRVAPHRFPDAVSAICVEADVVDRFGTDLTPALRDALSEAVACVLREIDAPEDIVRQGFALASSLSHWSPAPDEALGG